MKKHNSQLVHSFIACLVTPLIALVASQANAATELFFIHNDHLGTPQVVTDQNQVVVWAGHQKPFGEVDTGTNIISNDASFPGQHLDKETGYYYNYYRDYDPSLGRYLQSDPIGQLYDYSDPKLQIAIELGLVDPIEAYGVINHIYGYVEQNPINWIDPTGLACFDSACIYRAKQAAKAANKLANKQIRDAAKDARIPKDKQRDFRNWVEKNKKEEGRGGADNYTWDELKDLAEEYKDSYCR